MSIVRCPRCRDEVTVPARATSRALVRCPLCLEQYLLAEALAGSPPLLVIIGGEVEQAAIDDSPEPGIEYTVAAGGFDSTGFDSTVLNATAPAAHSVMAPRPILRTTPRPRRKEQSGLSFFLSVVGGGLLAAPLALLTLWWAFGVDPVELGPKIAQHAPWIVPSQFHGQPLNNPPPKEVGAAAVMPTKEMPTKLQTPPALEEPARLPLETVTPPIDPPNLQGRDADDAPKVEPTVKPTSILRDVPKTEAPSDLPMPDLTDLLPDEPTPRLSERPEMPDLTDLLPDGPIPQFEGQAQGTNP